MKQSVEAALANGLLSFGGPGGALVCFGAGLVLARSGVEGGLLGEVEFLDRCRGTFVVGLELGHQRAGGGSDSVTP
jgi:hypothetical protein